MILASRIFKARYYVNGSILTAQLGNNPSYIWRSILEAQSLLKQGIGCRIGNGQDVDIVNMPWLPVVSDPYVHTVSATLVNQKVISLMNIGERTWDTDLIIDLFEARDAEIIMAIPLGEEGKDSWYWRHEKMVFYSVKSAYILLQDAKISNHSGDNSVFWRQLWNLKIPMKVKNFLWRAASQCLPTKDLIRMRRIDVNTLCHVCNVEAESILHSLVKCPFADSCHSSTVATNIPGDFNTFSEWLQLVFDHRKQTDIQAQVMVCWMLWKNRNDLVWNQHSMDTSEIVSSALSDLNQWQAVQDRTFDSFLGFMTPEDGLEQWHLPEFNRVKVNIDAALFEEPSRYSHAIIIRDHTGRLIEAVTKCSAGRVSPELAEALGIREALSWVKKENRVDVVVETDCLKVVQLIRSAYSSLSYLGRVVAECKDLLFGLKNQNMMLRFVKRSANRVAHYLARYSCSIADRTWRVGDVHSDFYSVLCKDLIQ